MSQKKNFVWLTLFPPLAMASVSLVFFVSSFLADSVLLQTTLPLSGAIFLLGSLAYSLARHRESAYLISENAKRRTLQKLRNYLLEDTKISHVVVSGKLKFIFFDTSLEIRRRKEIFEFSYKSIKEAILERSGMAFKPLSLIIRYEHIDHNRNKEIVSYRFEADSLLLFQLLKKDLRIINYEFLNPSSFVPKKKKEEGISFSLVLNGIYLSTIYAIAMVFVSLLPVLLKSENYALTITMGFVGFILIVTGSAFLILKSAKLTIRKEQVVIYRLMTSVRFEWKDLRSVVVYYRKNAIVFLDKHDNTYRFNIVSRKLIQEIYRHAKDKILLCF